MAYHQIGDEITVVLTVLDLSPVYETDAITHERQVVGHQLVVGPKDGQPFLFADVDGNLMIEDIPQPTAPENAESGESEQVIAHIGPAVVTTVSNPPETVEIGPAPETNIETEVAIPVENKVE